jgi:hypothetical protein
MTDETKPRRRTPNTPFQLTEEDLRRLNAIREYFRYWDRVDAVRHAMDVVYRQIEGQPPMEKIREKYTRPS